MRILAIGNSFSEDATRYLHGIAQSGGYSLDVVDLVIGGCSLETHYRNMLSGERRYFLDMNGTRTGFMVSLSEALTSQHWDVITLQQVSHDAPKYKLSVPYASELASYIRKCAPSSKLVIQQTWAYEDGSRRLRDELGYECSADMLRDVISTYERMAEDISADGIIPSGELMMKLACNGIDKVHRDTFHAHLGVSRYALALLWYRYLTGRSVMDNSFDHFDVPVSDEEKKIAEECVESFAPMQW